jgi:hypothetical protein
MPPATVPQSDSHQTDLLRTLEQLAADIRARYRDVLRELRLDHVEGGLILRGRATRFYGKQVAFHEVKRLSRLVVLANQIVVQE